MNVLVTGSHGFLGSHLVERLISEGHYVLGMDNLFTGKRENIKPHARFEFVRHDVCDPFHIDADVIFHLACPASPIHYQKNPVRTIKTAFLGTLHALECARDTHATLVVASTSEVYGDPLEHPQTESYWGNVNPVGIRANYDEGKRAGEALCASWKSQFPDTQIRIARIFNSYGPRMATGDGRLIPNFISQAMKREPMRIYGTGEQTRSFCYATDTIAGLIALSDVVDKWFGSRMPIVNIGNPEERTIRSVAEDVMAFFPDATFVFAPLPKDDPKRRCPDISHARELLGWEPKVSYSEGIRKTVEWFLSQT